MSISFDGALKIWAPDAEDVPLLRGRTSSVIAAAFSPDGCTLFAIGATARLYEWDLATCTPRRWWSLGKATYDMKLWTDSSGLNVVLACMPNAKQADVTFAALTDDGALVTERLLAGDGRRFDRLVLTSDQQRLVAGGDGPLLHVWSRNGRNDWGEAQVFDSEGAAVTDIVALDDSARWVVICTDLRDSGGPNLSLQVWDLRTGRRIAVPLEHSGLLALRLALSRDGSLLAVGTYAGPILLFNVDRHNDKITLQPDGRLDGHTRYITALAFHPSERRLVSGARDQAVKVWDLDAETEVAALHGHPTCAACLVFDAAGEQLVSGSVGAPGMGNVVRLWETQRSRDLDASRATALRAYHEALRYPAPASAGLRS